MRKKSWPALVLAMASGTLAAYLAFGYLDGSAAPPPAAKAHGPQVAVAAHDLAIGSVLGAGDVKLVDWPSDALPAGYAGSPEALIGRGVVTPLRANEPLLPGKLGERGAGGGLPVIIPEGMRAVSVRVDEVIGVAGFVVPGTRVDVLVTMSPRSGGTEATSLVALQNVQVVAAGQSIQQDSAGKPQTVAVITLLVTPQQAETLTLASTEGRIQLALRNTLDAGSVHTSGTRVSSMVGGAPAAPAAAPAPRRSAEPARPAPPRPHGPEIEVFRGSTRTVTTF
ncbi:MAG: Flp pilus assembly protein CpaB [Gemmatimonadetes bacterium]|nr:Flp pilus assembly protein CpaB [Gemmatimonadota bacterium]